MAGCKLLSPLNPNSEGRFSMKRKIALGLLVAAVLAAAPAVPQPGKSEVAKMTLKVGDAAPDFTDRKSTRLNSSHSQISYAVFCLKKKKKNTTTPIRDEHRNT